MIGLDANVVVRYLTQDDPKQWFPTGLRNQQLEAPAVHRALPAPSDHFIERLFAAVLIISATTPG